MRIILIIILSLMYSSAYCDSNREEVLEKTYRNLLISIHEKNINKIIKFVHEDGVYEADTAFSKGQLHELLNDPNDSFSKRFFELPGRFEKDMCKESGRFPISPYAFFKYYGEKYIVHISRYKDTDFYQISSVGNAEVEPIKGCQFIVFSVGFKYESDGKFYLTGVFGP